MQFTGEATSVVVEINMLGLYLTMIGILRQLSEPRLRQQGGIEKSQTPVERDILVQWVRNAWHILVCHHSFSFLKKKSSVILGFSVSINNPFKIT